MLVVDSADNGNNNEGIQYVVVGDDEVQNFSSSTTNLPTLNISSSGRAVTNFQFTSLLPLKIATNCKNPHLSPNAIVSGYGNGAVGFSKDKSSKSLSNRVTCDVECSDAVFVSLDNLNGFIRCEVCDKPFIATDYLEHVKRCLLEKPLKCEHCGEEYNKEENMVVHHIIKHSELVVVENEQRICPLCLKQFNRTSAYYGHLKQHYIKETLSCSYCNEEFEYLGLLNRHVRTSHLSAEEHCFSSSQICNRCCILVPNKLDMERHLLVHRKVSKAMRCPKRRGDKTTRLHKCTVCEKSFGKLYELTRHSVVHTRDKKFKCDHCGKKFSQKSSMKQHMKSHLLGELSVYKCELCEASFSQAGNLRRHIASLHPVNISSRSVFRCPRCSCVFGSIQPLQVHIGKRHAESTRFTDFNTAIKSTSLDVTEPQKTSCKRRLTCCSICGKAFLKSDELVRHYQTHCNGISAKFHPESFTDMQQHTGIANHSQLDINKSDVDRNMVDISFFCQKKAISDATSQSSEISALESYSFQMVKCRICTKMFKSQNELKEHFQNQHNETTITLNEEVLDEECNEQEVIEHSINDDGRLLKSQTKVDSSGRDAIFGLDNSYLLLPVEKNTIATCSVCYNTFNSCQAIFEHLSAVSDDNNHKYASLNCSHCSNNFIGYQDFWEHFRSVHYKFEKESRNSAFCTSRYISANCSRKVHQCEVCSRTFAKPSDLARHHRIHTGEKPFKCEICERCFRVKSTLYQHMKVHDDCREDSRCVCSVCNRSYGSNSALKLHLKMAHIEERSYKCIVPNCDFRFVTQRQCDIHVKRFHKKHKGEKQGSICTGTTDDQFTCTVQQLTPSLKNARIVEQSQTSAFSKLNPHEAFDGTTHIALKIRPSVSRGSVEIYFFSLCGINADDDSIIIELSVLRPLVSDGLLLKVQIATHFLSCDSFLAVDARRVFKLLENRQTGIMNIPLNAETDLTNLPFAVFATGCGLTPTGLANFLTTCVVCEETFTSEEQSLAHFRSEDHETAQLFAFTNTGGHLPNQTFVDTATHHYQTVPLKSAPTDFSKFGPTSFVSGNWLEHTVRDDLELLVRPNVRVRRRTLD